MAAPSFPARKRTSTSNAAMPGGSASQLDAPPPSPVEAPMGGQGPTGPMPMFSEMTRPMTPGTPGQATSPETLMGMMASMETIAGMYDAMAGLVPELATDFALLKDLGQRTMAKLLVKGGQAASPQNPGLSFPGGGFERGA